MARSRKTPFIRISVKTKQKIRTQRGREIHRSNRQRRIHAYREKYAKMNKNNFSIFSGFFFIFNIGLAACQRLDDHIGSFDAYHAIIAINTKFLRPSNTAKSRCARFEPGILTSGHRLSPIRPSAEAISRLLGPISPSFRAPRLRQRPFPNSRPSNPPLFQHTPTPNHPQPFLAHFYLLTKVTPYSNMIGTLQNIHL